MPGDCASLRGFLFGPSIPLSPVFCRGFFMGAHSMRFGRTSLEHLSTCDPRLQRVAHRALGYGIYDFSVIAGYRTPEQQLIAFREGRSDFDGILKRSKHNQMPSLGMDLLPWPPTVNGLNVWDDAQRFHVLAGIVLASAAEEGIALRWGGDWDGDGNNIDATLHDLPHFELLT